MNSSSANESRPGSEKRKKSKGKKKEKSNSVDLGSEKLEIVEEKKGSIKLKISKNSNSNTDNIRLTKKTNSTPTLSPRKSSSPIGTSSGKKSKKSKERQSLETSFYCKYTPFSENDEELIRLMEDPNVEFDESLRKRLHEALLRYEDAKNDISILEEHKNIILDEIKDTKDSIQILEKRTCDAQELYNSLYKEYNNVKDLLGKVENEGLNLVQNVALLDQKILSFQRKVNKNFINQLIVFLVSLVIHIICSPIYLGTFIYDTIINNHVKKNIETNGNIDDKTKLNHINIKQSRKLKDFHKFLKSHVKKLESFLDYIEDLIMNRKRD